MEIETKINRTKLTAKVHYRSNVYGLQWTAAHFTIPDGLSPEDKVRAIRHSQRQLREVVQSERDVPVSHVEVNFYNPQPVLYSDQCEYAGQFNDVVLFPDLLWDIEESQITTVSGD